MVLLPERAIWWPAQKALLLSDLHWGKSAHFRKNGIPMPGSTQRKDGLRLAELVSRFGAERMIIAGDFFHSKHNKEVDDFGTWREAHTALHIDFILGNHDILSPALYKSFNLTVHQQGLLINSVYIAHDLEEDSEHFTIHGHIHPGVRVHGLGRQGFSLPCYCVNEKCMVLPAFGQFTGCHLINPDHYKHIYLVGDGKVMSWK